MILRNIFLTCCVFLLCNASAWSKKSKRSSVLVIIRGQSDIFNHKAAYDKMQQLEEQIEKYQIKSKVLLLHREWPVEAAWSITPLIPDISVTYGDDYQWVLFIEEHTNVDLNKLTRDVLPQHQYDDDVILGSCLHDNEPTIIHHFAFIGDTKSFKYPDLDAGMVISTGLLQTVRDDWHVDNSKAGFQIDVKHELAKMLFDQYDVKLTCAKELCSVERHDGCVTWLKGKQAPKCGGMVDIEDVQFSVKTTKKFHVDRLPVVQKTWGKYAKLITYYSNHTDDELGTIDCGVPNTESGHCGKMEKIIRDAERMKDDIKWLVIADDDTIMSVSRLLELLNCYNHKSSVVLGERYGFGLNTGYGYSYITGGGGMVMSQKAVADFVKKNCRCPHISAPDDMYLGQCFSNKVGIPVIHSNLFHQARPVDYSDGFLNNQIPISFHKHWMIDPLKVYNDWFAQADKVAFGDLDSTATAAPLRDEL